MVHHPSHIVALTALATAAALLLPAAASADQKCIGERSITLSNGRIHTMDAADHVVSSVTIRNGRFVAPGDDHGSDGCSKSIDLQGRVVLPGLIDNHNHFLLLGLRPGYHTPIENAASFADIASLYHARIAGAPAGVFITSIGGFVPAQFAENRLPNLTELDAIAPKNPVYLQIAFTGPSTTNSLGKAFFTAKGVTVGADGSIADGVSALNALRTVQTYADQLRGTMDAMDYSAQLGLTDNFDMGGFINPGSPDHDSEFTFPGAASWDSYTAYDTILDLHRQGKMKVRVRVFFLSMDTDPGIPILSHRVENAFREFGDDWLRAAGLGEFITSWPLFGLPDPANYDAAVLKAASRGWIYQQHSLSDHEDDLSLTAWEKLKPMHNVDIAPLHWSIAHVPAITAQNTRSLFRLKALGAGTALHGWKYLYGSTGAGGGGPAYRTILNSGVHAGAGSDSAQISTLNPWNMLYYMTTGIDAHGDLVNAGETITRQQALRLYTAENGWFSKEEDKMGSIEAGKYGDLIVLSDDYFTVPDSALRKIRSVLTVVGGRITYDAGVLGTGGDD